MACPSVRSRGGDILRLVKQRQATQLGEETKNRRLDGIEQVCVWALSVLSLSRSSEHETSQEKETAAAEEANGSSM